MSDSTQTVPGEADTRQAYEAVTLRLGPRRKRSEIAASRSFLVDVHLLKDK